MSTNRESLFEPGKLWSLWDMLERKAHLYLALGQRIGIVRTGFELEAGGFVGPNTPEEVEINDKSRDELTSVTLQEIATMCSDLGLPTASAVVTRALSDLGILGFVVNDIGPAKTFVIMLLQTIVLILVYALIYFYRLPIDGITFGDSMYYSVLTWTSLGYADLSPKGEMRLVTASQAITGYIFLGLLVSVLASVVGQPRKSG